MTRVLAPVRTPARPGPGPMPEPLLRALDLRVRRRMASVLAGDHRSSEHGLGSELAQLRPYEPGDDVRRLDANATARTGVPHVRVDVAERALATWLLLDTSPSMTFGTADRRKADVAEGVALAVAHIASRRANRLGVLTFGGRTAATRPLRQGRAGLVPVLALVREADAEADVGGVPVGATSLGDTLARAARLARQRSVVFLVSDFRGPRDWRRPLLQLAHRHDVVAVEIRDPREGDLPDVGDLWLVDPETGRQLRVDTARRKVRERFAAAAAAERASLAAELRSAGVDHVVLSTAGDWLRPFAAFVRSRGVRP